MMTMTRAALLGLVLGLLMLMAASVLPASAATGSVYLNGVTAPAGSVNMGTHLWVADHALGFCRVDTNATGANFVNQNTCADTTKIVSPGQPYYNSANNFVYIPDNSSKSQGVWRVKFDPTTQTIGAPVLMAPGKGLGGNKPTSVTIAGDGKLYVGFIKTGSVVRVTNPAGDPLTQAVESVGGTSDGKGISGMTFVSSATAGPGLYLAEGGAITRIGTPGGCAGGCKAVAVAGISATAPSAITSDRSDVLYVADTPVDVSSVLRYTISSNTQDVYATKSDAGVQFSNVSGLGLDSTGNLYVGDDPSAGAQILQGHVYFIAAGSAPEIAGTAGAPPAPPAPPALKTGSLYADAVTAPAGEVMLGSNLWVSDHAQGFCRLDDPDGDGKFNINPNTCNTSAVSPGQPYYDSAKNFVYVPDNSANSQGVWRYKFDPTTQTISSAVLMAPGKGLGGNKPVAVALAGDGKLYVGFLKNGSVVRVTNPAGDPLTQAVESVGGTSDGRRVLGMTFVSSATAGPGLYLAEGGAITRIGTPGGCAGGCKAVAVAGISATAPSAITSDRSDVLYVADTPVDASSVLRFTISSGTQDVYANKSDTGVQFSNVSGLGLDSAGNLYVGDDPSAGAQVIQGRVWKVAAL